MPTPMPEQSRIAIIGGGPAGLMAAEVLARETAGRALITVYDRMPSLGRKLLIAGRGGLNLTHAEGRGDDLAAFLSHYDRAGASAPVAAAIAAFPPDALVGWAESLGQEMFTGSSGRIFPKAASDPRRGQLAPPMARSVASAATAWPTPASSSKSRAPASSQPSQRWRATKRTP